MGSDIPVPATRELVVRVNSRPTARSGVSAGGNSGSSGYASSTSTNTLINASSKARGKRVGAKDMLSIAEAARLMAVEPATIRSWVRDGRVIAVDVSSRASRLPRWQFEPAMREAIPGIAKALGTKHGWAVLGFLETPCGMLDGMTPREAVERGRLQLVLDAALAASF